MSTPAKHYSHHHTRVNRDSPDTIFGLQQAIGNQAVQTLMRSKSKGLDFSKIGVLQPKLRVSQPNDVYEQEADKVAEQVMRMTVSSHSVMPTGIGKDDEIDRKCGACEMEEKEDEEKQLNISRKPSTAAFMESNDELAGNINNLRHSGGSALDTSSRLFMESRFGYDFGDVRIHTDEMAKTSATSLNALAYTVGNNIVFGHDNYHPSTIEGRRLLAHELTHVVQESRSASTPSEIRILRQIAELLDYNQLADQIHSAIAGLGTDEEAVYLALQRLQRDPTAIGRLESAYLSRHGEQLEDAIRGDFSGTELEYALQLLSRGTAGAAQAIGTRPSSPTAFDTEAIRLHAAMEGAGTDEEAIFAVLASFRRSTGSIQQLKDAYFALYHEDLRDRIIDEMSGTELDNALYLMGERTWETTEVSLPEAERLFKGLSGATFVMSAGTDAPIPFHYPPDGCYARAHLMAELLTATGYGSEKVFAVSRIPGLEVSTPLAADVAVGAKPVVSWWYHVAPILHLRDATGALTEMVIDPSTASGPITIVQWTGLMSTGSFTRMTLPQLDSHLAAHPGFTDVTNPRLVFTTPRTVFLPPAVSGFPVPPTTAEAERIMETKVFSTSTGMKSGREVMSEYAQFALLHEVAAVMRDELSKPGIDVARIIAALQKVPPPIRSWMWLKFPNLRIEIGTRLTPAQLALIDAEVSAISVPSAP